MVTKERLAELASSKAFVIGTTSVLSFAAGAGAGTAIAIRKLNAKYNTIMEREIADARTFYKKLYKRGEFSAPADLGKLSSMEDHDDVVEEESELLDDAVQALASYQGESENDVTDDRPETATNVFDKEEDEWDWSEIDHRDPTKPYIIHHDEFMQGEKDYEQQTVTYFEGDDVLTDDRDGRIDDVEDTVGEDNLMKFGHGSKDNNVVYIRNDRMCVDFEVMRSTGKYSEQVLGFIEHSDSRQSIRRFRSDDE